MQKCFFTSVYTIQSDTSTNSITITLSSCIPYLAGVVVTSRMNANSRKDCVSQGGEYIDGSSWGWSGGKCIMPEDNIKVENLTPEE